MNRRRAGLAALALALTASASPLRAAGDDTLHLESAGWAIAGRPLALHVEPRGPLADKRLTVIVFVDDERVGKFDLPRRAATHALPTAGLAPGRHRLLLKCGSERIESSFRVLPGWLPWAAGAALAAALALFVRSRRRATG